MSPGAPCYTVSPIENHRKREKGVLVYPVYSRRSGGLSVGVNLFPDRKRCSFDCPYCEVFPFATNAVFSPEQMEKDLRSALAVALKQGIPVRDICFSGNGEPTMSEDFHEALRRAGRVRDEMVSGAELVLITNGSGLLDEGLFSVLRDAARGSLALDIWLKADAGTSEWYEKIDRSDIPFEKIISKIKEFCACAPLTVQTMLCAVDGREPPSQEAEAWIKLIVELAVIAGASAASGKGGAVRKIQIYGKARPAPCDPKASPLPAEYLEERARSLRSALAATPAACNGPPVEVYP